jgi:hypothetical protein
MDMADHTTDGLIILHIARLTTVPTTVRVSTGWIGAASREPISKSRSKMSAMARLRHADLVEQCPFAGVHRKTFAQAKFFSV